MKIIFNEDEIKEMILKSDKFKEYFTVGQHNIKEVKDKMSFHGEDSDGYEHLYIYDLRIEIEIGG